MGMGTGTGTTAGTKISVKVEPPRSFLGKPSGMGKQFPHALLMPSRQPPQMVPVGVHKPPTKKAAAVFTNSSKDGKLRRAESHDHESHGSYNLDSE